MFNFLTRNTTAVSCFVASGKLCFFDIILLFFSPKFLSYVLHESHLTANAIFSRRAVIATVATSFTQSLRISTKAITSLITCLCASASIAQHVFEAKQHTRSKTVTTFLMTTVNAAEVVKQAKYASLTRLSLRHSLF